MARIHGRRGRLYVGLSGSSSSAEPVTYLNAWAANFTVDKVEVTAFGDTNKTYVSGLPDAAGTFAGFYDTDTAQLYTAANDGLPRKFYLYPDTADTDYWFGQGLFDFSATGGTGQAVDISGTWAAASAIIQVKS